MNKSWGVQSFWSLAIFAALAAAVALVSAQNYTVPRQWEANYAFWRHRQPIPLQQWRDRFPLPHGPLPDNLTEFLDMSPHEREQSFYSCIENQAVEMQRRVLRYASPGLRDVRAAVRAELDARGAQVVVGVFWGRLRYVRILQHYLARNVRANGGVADKIVLFMYSREPFEGGDGNAAIAEALESAYPGVIVRQPMCKVPFGCVFSEHMTDQNTVYIKFDDDTMFIKDGSLEHLVYENLMNEEYTSFSGNIVNHPHCAAVHRFIGAYPPESYHWRVFGTRDPPFFNRSLAIVWYYGRNLYDLMGSQAHEAFVYNIAMNRLDVYTFDVWNFNQCRCSRPQEGLEYSDENGYYLWNANAIAFRRKDAIAKESWVYKVPSFDEPFISMIWPQFIPPHRSGIVGESLFVHMQYILQRDSSPDFGLREDVYLPFYEELARQYCATGYGEWRGNRTLLLWYEEMQVGKKEKLYGGWPHWNCVNSPWAFEKETCPEPEYNGY
jgi:hypothetical protein